MAQAAEARQVAASSVQSAHGQHNLHDACRGTLPSSLDRLSNLQWMLLDNNQLTGTLPAILGQMPSLKRVLLQNNRFAGPVPSSWCAGNATFDVSNNQKLCGEQLAAAFRW